MDTTRQAITDRMLARPTQPEVRARHRLGDIAAKGLHDPDSLSRVEILEMCKLVFCRLTSAEDEPAQLEMARRSEAVREMVRLSKELGLE